MSDTTIQGLRFRRVTLSNGAVASEVKARQRCDALICRRCTAVLRDDGEAARHVCVTFYWMSGLSLADVETVETPDRIRARASVANNAMLANLWPHGAKLIAKRDAAPLFERYELLATLFAELAKMERGAQGYRTSGRRRKSAT